MSMHFAVMGYPISHSLSPLIHQTFAQQVGISLTYEKFQVQDTEAFHSCVFDFFNQGGKGLNITAPFKEKAFEMAQIRTPRCQQAKAANTLWMEAGLLHADTTDGIGLIRDISRTMILEAKHVLLIGAGGAARSVIPSLLAEKIAQLTLVNRTESRLQALKADFPAIQSQPFNQLQSPYDLIIYACSEPVFLEVKQEKEQQSAAFACLLPALKSSSYFYDLNYNIMHPTPFIKWAYEQGCLASDGLGMLVEQAAESFFVWHGVRPHTEGFKQVIVSSIQST